MIDSGPRTRSRATLNRCASDALTASAELLARARLVKVSRQAMLRQGGVGSVIRGKDHDS
jgi:hypothetical protein